MLHHARLARSRRMWSEIGPPRKPVGPFRHARQRRRPSRLNLQREPTRVIAGLRPKARDPARKRSLFNRMTSLRILERAKGFEPSTPTLARLCSTPELRPRSVKAGCLSLHPANCKPPGHAAPPMSSRPVQGEGQPPHPRQSGPTYWPLCAWVAATSRRNM